MSSNSSKLRRFLMCLGVLGWVFFGFMLAQALALGVIEVLKWVGLPLSALSQSLFTTLTNILVYALSLLIITGVPWKLKKSMVTWADLGLSRGPHALDFVWPLAGATVYIILESLITVVAMVIFPHADYQQAQQTGFAVLSNRWEYLLAFLSLVIIAPVAEEIMFRGYLLSRLRKYAPTWVAVVLTAGLFAVAHGQWNVGLDTFALGVVLALLRVYSGSLWPSLFLHMLKNGVAFYFLFVNPLFL